MSGLLGKHQGRTGPISGLNGAGMVKILEKSTGSVSEWQFDKVFDHRFQNYLINISNLVPVSNNVNAYFKLLKNSDGSQDSASEYRSMSEAGQAEPSTQNNAECFSRWDQNQWRINPAGGGVDGSVVWSGFQGNLFLHNPMSGTTYTTFTGCVYQMANSVKMHSGTQAGIFHATTAHSGFKLYFSSGNVQTGDCTVYGLA